MSVGFVGPKSAYTKYRPDEAGLAARIAATPVLAERLSSATRIEPVRSASDFSYACRQVSGDGFLLVGDAAAFLDPVFSTGVHLGLLHAFFAADSIDAALSRDNVRRSAFKSYERFVAGTLDTYRGLVRGFYTPELVEMFLAPSDRLDLRRAVTTLLAGAGTNQVAIAWRVGLFRALARANRHLVLVPRLTGRRSAAPA
jgi:2-polyprenyl-6-methoxyphenol hydroxylase-like FAD-dependent oxidoreductase